MLRSQTMPNLRDQQQSSQEQLNKQQNKQKQPANKLDAEREKINQETHDRILKMQHENRKKEVALIRPETDIKILRLKNKELEKSKGAQPNLKQNMKDHLNTLYQQESKYLGERAELYKTPTYNPYLLKQYVESVKPEPRISASFTNGSGYNSQKNVYVTEESNEYRPKMFADKTFNDFSNLKRLPYENVLCYPSASADPQIQENGFIQQQSTYGQTYNTKKYLQENELAGMRKTAEPVYRQLDQAELDHQNVTLKTRVEQVALDDYKNGITSEPDLRRATELVDKYDKEKKEYEQSQYPRLAGPIPPEPYEPFYCNVEISEMSNGLKKPIYSRCYDSVNVAPSARFEPLRSDLQAMAQFEAREIEEQTKHQQYLEKIKNEALQNAEKIEVTYRNTSNDTVARRETDKITRMVLEQVPTSTYSSSYTPYANKSLAKCPPNQFYHGIEYSESSGAKMNAGVLPANLLSLQDQWSRTIANNRYHSAYTTKSADLRENIIKGKKIIKDSPMNAAKFATVVKWIYLYIY